MDKTTLSRAFNALEQLSFRPEEATVIVSLLVLKEPVHAADILKESVELQHPIHRSKIYSPLTSLRNQGFVVGKGYPVSYVFAPEFNDLIESRGYKLSNDLRQKTDKYITLLRSSVKDVREIVHKARTSDAGVETFESIMAEGTTPKVLKELVRAATKEMSSISPGLVATEKLIKAFKIKE